MQADAKKSVIETEKRQSVVSAVEDRQVGENGVPAVQTAESRRWSQYADPKATGGASTGNAASIAMMLTTSLAGGLLYSLAS